MKNGFRALVGLAALIAVGALLYLLNPDIDDFAAYQQRRSSQAVSQSVGEGSLGQAISGAAGGLAALGARNLFERQDLLIASLYTRSLRGETMESYLGIAKLFIPLKKD